MALLGLGLGLVFVPTRLCPRSGQLSAERSGVTGGVFQAVQKDWAHHFGAADLWQHRHNGIPGWPPTWTQPVAGGCDHPSGESLFGGIAVGASAGLGRALLRTVENRLRPRDERGR